TIAELEGRFRRNCRVGFGAIAPDVVDRTSNRFGFIPAVPGLLTGGSADDAEQKLTPEIDCFRFCPYTRDSTETTQHLGGLGNRIFNLIDLGERRGRKWQGPGGSQITLQTEACSAVRSTTARRATGGGYHGVRTARPLTSF